MRLACDVEIIDRALACLSVKKAGKPIRGQLSVGKHSGTVYLMLCTSKDKNGAKFKIKDNIDKVFTKFLAEGKATIRLKQPEKDICISKADIIHLKSFLNVLKMVLQGKDLDEKTLSTLMPGSNKQVERPKTHLVITSKKNYPLTTNFPVSLTHLQIHSCGMKRLDSRICSLRNLTSLDLSDNSLTDIIDDIGRLQCLADLKLRNNKFDKFPKSLCFKESLQKSLHVLDLSGNQVRQLPVYICELRNLITLKMDNNLLEVIPPTLGRLSNLKTVTLSGNKLKILPAGFLHLTLDNVDLFNNEFIETENQVSADHVDVPTLLECAARYVRKNRIAYSDEDLHGHLCRYLDSARICWCGNFCFQCSVEYTRMVDLRRISSSVTAIDSGGRTLVPVKGYLCSPQCLNKFKIDPHAYWR